MGKKNSLIDSMENDLLKNLDWLIETEMINPSMGNEIAISNLRVIYDLLVNGQAKELQKVLVENFCGFYCHTMMDENPVDVLTTHFMVHNIKMKMSEESKKSDDIN